MISGAGTTGTVSIKFRGTKLDSPLFKFKTGLTQGSLDYASFGVNDIGMLSFVYLEIDSTDSWRFQYVSVQIDDSYVIIFDDSFILRSDTTTSIWLQGFFFFQSFSFSFTFVF